jgi:WD40 repeat protein/tRNA A-37 threonylcarbamoyl transferase component Bud32
MPAYESNLPHVRGYEILGVVGCGGMGIVYKARHRELRRTVALKMLRGAALTDPEFQGRFQAEAEAVAQLQHPNIIQVFEVGTVESSAAVHSPFIALEFVEGGSLNKLTERPQAPRFVAELVEKLARAVESAHRIGVVHRDLKPANILLTADGEPKIADFGLAKQLGSDRDAGGRFFTMAGTVVGTPEYMAPEQARGDAPTPAVDIYALGVILYELLTGRVPFQAATPVETMNLLRLKEAVPPRQLAPNVPRDLETICLKCLEKEPGKRYATAGCLAEDLRCFLENRPIQARRTGEIERFARRCRRNPLVTALIAGVVAIFLAAFVLVTRSYWNADAARRQEAAQRQEAEAKEEAERRERYRANIMAAGNSLRVHDASAAGRSLEDAPEAYRNWEWKHFQSRLDLSEFVLRSEEAHRDASISADGRRAFLHGEQGRVEVWDLLGRKQIFKVAKMPENCSPSSSGLLYAQVSRDPVISIRELATDRLLCTLKGHTAAVHTLQFAPDDSWVFTGSEDQSVRVWEVATGRQVAHFKPYDAGLFSAAISPNGKFVVTAKDRGRNVDLWEAATGRRIANLPGHEKGIQGSRFTDSGDRLVTVEGFPANNLHLWDTVTGQRIGKVMTGHENMITQLAFDPKGERLVSSAMDQTVRLWDVRKGEKIRILSGHNGRVAFTRFSPDGSRLLSASQDNTVRLWDATSGEPLAVMTGHTAPVAAANFSADGSRIFSASQDGTVREWNVRQVESEGKLTGHQSYVYSVAFFPDGKRVLSSAWDGTARVWDATSGEEIRRLSHGDNTLVVAVAIHPAGRLAATRSRHMNTSVHDLVTLWDVETGKELHHWPAAAHGWIDTRLAFSPDGGLLAVGCHPGEVRVWDVESRAEVACLRGHTDDVRDLAFSPDGQLLATAGEAGDRTVRIWHVGKKECVAVLEGHRDCVYSLAFNPRGTILASGSLDGTVRLWDTSQWGESKELTQVNVAFGLAFTPDGTRLALGCQDNSIRLWDVDRCQPIAELRGHRDYVHSISFSPDGSRLASASGDRTVRIWDTLRPQDRKAGR